MADIFDAMDRFLKNQKQDTTTQGVIVNIAGTTALVKITGSDRVQEAWYNKGANLAPGDHCILQRTSGNAKWVVVGGYGTQLSGINEQTVATAPGVAGNSESVSSYINAANGTATATIPVGNHSSYGTVASVGLTTTKNLSAILAGFSGGYNGTSASTAGTWIAVKILVGGVEVARTNANLAKSSWAGETIFYSNVSLCGLRRSVAKGFYNVEVLIQSPYSSIEDGNIVVPQLFAVEI